MSSGATALLVATPLLTGYFHNVLHIPVELYAYARLGIGACVFVPLLTALSAWARGLLVADSATPQVYQGMGVNLTTHGLTLCAGVLLHLPGMLVAAGATTLAASTEYLYLVRSIRQVAAHHAAHEQSEYERMAIGMLGDPETSSL